MPQVQRPSWLNLRDFWLNRGEKDAPNFSLPDNRKFGTVSKRKDQTYAAIIGKAGVNGVMSTDAPAGTQYTWTHSSHLALNGRAGENLIESDVRQLARMVPVGPLNGNEFREGSHSVAEDSQQCLWWYDERRIMHQQAGIPYFDLGTYGTNANTQGGFWFDNNGGHVQPTNPFWRNRRANQAAARAANATYFDRIAPTGCGTNVKNYADQPDYLRFLYNKWNAIEELNLGMGRVGGVGPGYVIYFDWHKLESLPGGGNLHNSIRYRRPLPNGTGTVVTEAHPQIDYDEQLTGAFFLGFCLGAGYMTFDIRNRFGINPNEMPTLNPNPTAENGIYVGWMGNNGAAAPVTADGFPFEPQRGMDVGYEAAYMYAQCSRTAGEPWRHVRWRFENSQDWYEPAGDGATILEAASAFDGPHAVGNSVRRGRPIVMARNKNAAGDLAATDPSRPRTGKRETIIAEIVPNRPVQIVMQGGAEMKLFNESI